MALVKASESSYAEHVAARDHLSPMKSNREWDAPKHELALVTERSVNKTSEAVDVIYEPPAVGRQITWMGGDGERVIMTVDQSCDYKQNAELRKQARKSRARSIREATAFLDEVERTLAIARGEQPFDEGEALSRSQFEKRKVEAQRARSGELYVSAFDGTTHELEDVAAYNAFVHDRMVEVMEDEVERENEGEVLSAGGSVWLAQSDIGTSQAAPRHTTRRPEGLPDLDQWVKDIPKDNSGRNEYNEEARNVSRSLMAYRCFRKCDFLSEYQRIQAFESA